MPLIASYHSSCSSYFLEKHWMAVHMPVRPCRILCYCLDPERWRSRKRRSDKFTERVQHPRFSEFQSFVRKSLEMPYMHIGVGCTWWSRRFRSSIYGIFHDNKLQIPWFWYQQRHFSANELMCELTSYKLETINDDEMGMVVSNFILLTGFFTLSFCRSNCLWAIILNRFDPPKRYCFKRMTNFPLGTISFQNNPLSLPKTSTMG